MSSEFLQDFVTIIPISILFLASLIPLLIKVALGNREPKPLFTLSYGFIGLIFATAFTAGMTGGQKVAFNGAIVLDGVSAWSSCLVYLITAVTLMISFDNIATNGRQFTEYTFLLLSSAIGMVVLIMSNDLIVTFIGIETMSLCLYILIAMSKEQTLAKEAAFKYLILGSFASAVFLYGTALLWGTTGTTYFSGVGGSLPGLIEVTNKLISTNRIFVVGMAMVILGFAFKVSLFPFHAWTPDVYQGAPTPITAFMATGVKAATFVAFLRLFHADGFDQSGGLMSALTWIAVLTMFVGNAAAILQDNLKRVLAYSSVAHSGYAMVGLIAAAFGKSFDSAGSGVLFYLFSYAIMTLGSFAVVALYEKNENTALQVSDLRGLGKRHPVLALSLTLLLLSLAGLPPTVGFFGKFYVFSAAIEQDMYWPAFWGVVNSVISVYYYLRPVVMMYMAGDEGAEIVEASKMTQVTVVVSAVAIVALGFFASPIIQAVRGALQLF